MSAEFKVKASVGLSTGGAGSLDRAPIPLVERKPQSEEVFCNYHVVVMRKYGSYEDGSSEEM